MRGLLCGFMALTLVACVASPGEPVPGPQIDVPDGGGKPDDPEDHGCLDGWCDDDPDDDPDRPVCEPRPCDGQCGVIEDGCGGTMQCGPCACQPRTCDALGAACGVIDDGCGAELHCDLDPCSGSCVENQCVCDGDGAEPNDTADEAVDLGAVAEADGVELEQADVTLDEEGDIDWYVATVTDDWSWGEPIVHVDAMGEVGYIVTAYYFCDYGPDIYHTCERSEALEDGFGAGCRGAGHISLSTECDGSDESGTLYVAVEVGESAVVCEPYTVSIEAS